MELQHEDVLPTLAGMAELADAADSKSADPCGRGGSTSLPAPNIFNSNNSLRSIKPLDPRGFFVREKLWYRFVPDLLP